MGRAVSTETSLFAHELFVGLPEARDLDPVNIEQGHLSFEVDIYIKLPFLCDTALTKS